MTGIVNADGFAGAVPASEFLGCTARTAPATRFVHFFTDFPLKKLGCLKEIWRIVAERLEFYLGCEVRGTLFLPPFQFYLSPGNRHVNVHS